MPLMRLVQHGKSPSAEFPWMLHYPGKEAFFLPTYAAALQAARLLIENQSLEDKQAIVIAYVTSAIEGCYDDEVRMISNRSRAVVDMLTVREHHLLEGCDPAQAPELENGSTAHAAGAYLTAATAWSLPRELRQIALDSAEEWWPWAIEAWQPEHHALGNLYKALALLLAETERLERHRYKWHCKSPVLDKSVSLV